MSRVNTRIASAFTLSIVKSISSFPFIFFKFMQKKLIFCFERLETAVSSPRIVKLFILHNWTFPRDSPDFLDDFRRKKKRRCAYTLNAGKSDEKPNQKIETDNGKINKKLFILFWKWNMTMKELSACQYLFRDVFGPEYRALIRVQIH